MTSHLPQRGGSNQPFWRGNNLAEL